MKKLIILTLLSSLLFSTNAMADWWFNDANINLIDIKDDGSIFLGLTNAAGSSYRMLEVLNIDAENRMLAVALTAFTTKQKVRALISSTSNISRLRIEAEAP